MYLPKTFEEKRLDVLHDLIRTHSLGTWVSANASELDVHHIPFALDSERGEFGTLYGHVSRGNPIWKTQAGALPDVVIFRGPQAYVSPSWYPSKHQHGKAVPTWNYAVVAAHGRPDYIEDPAWLYAHLGRLTDTHEASQALLWKIDDAPAEFTESWCRQSSGWQSPSSGSRANGRRTRTARMPTRWASSPACSPRGMTRLRRWQLWSEGMSKSEPRYRGAHRANTANGRIFASARLRTLALLVAPDFDPGPRFFWAMSKNTKRDPGSRPG